MAFLIDKWIIIINVICVINALLIRPLPLPFYCCHFINTPTTHILSLKPIHAKVKRSIAVLCSAIDSISGICFRRRFSFHRFYYALLCQFLFCHFCNIVEFNIYLGILEWMCKLNESKCLLLKTVRVCNLKYKCQKCQFRCFFLTIQLHFPSQNPFYTSYDSLSFETLFTNLLEIIIYMDI